MSKPRRKARPGRAPGRPEQVRAEVPQPRGWRALASNRTLWLAMALIAVTVAVYAPVRHYDFVALDDPRYVSENPHVTGGLTGENVASAFSSAHGGFWIPLVWLSYMLDAQAFGLNAGAFHVTNLLLHIANTVLLFVFLGRTTGAPGRSAFVAALFAVHPLHVESVAWIAERKDVLSTLFGMLTLLAYARYAKQPRWDRYVAVLVLFALGLMAKPMLVTVPFVLLLLDVWPLGRVAAGMGAQGKAKTSPDRDRPAVWLALLGEKIPLFVLAGAASAVAVATQQQAGAFGDLATYSLRLRVENALVSYATYIGKMFWPARLAAYYPYPESLSAWVVCGAVLVLVSVSIGTLWLARRHAYLAVGWLWYLGTLVPTIGLVQVGIQARADRFTYVPLVGLFIIVAWGATDLLAGRSTLRRALPAAAVLVIAASAVTARIQLGYWKDSATFWTRITEGTLGTNSFGAHMWLGHALSAQGRTTEAIVHYSDAVRLNPADAGAHYALGAALGGEGRLNEAIASLSEAVRLRPAFAEAHDALGLALGQAGRTGEAAAHFSEALRLKPDLATAHNNFGALLIDQEKYAEALPHLAEAVRLDPTSELAHVNLGIALAKTGRIRDAVGEFEAALRINPNNEVARRAFDELATRDRGK